MDTWGHFSITASYLRSLLRKTSRLTSGKLTLFVALSGAFMLIIVGVLSFEVRVPSVSADNVTTSVTVLNTPPVWTVDAQESTESSTSTPTNAGSTLTFVGTGTDSNNDNYWLLICKTNGAPTPNVGAAPTCSGGAANQWAVSPQSTSGTQASAATTTKEKFPFNIESNDWFAFICDGNSSLPQCNAAVKQGSGITASPFVINHPPAFTLVTNTSPVIPGAAITWNSVASDTDAIRGEDTLKLIVCKANDFNGVSCGGGGAWATSTLSGTNPATTTTIVIPTQDKVYNAYVFLMDNNGLVATSSVEGTNSSFTVSNVAPTVSAATITLVDPNTAGNITLVHPNATSGPYQVKFQVTDNNSCLNASSGNEISSVAVNVFRSGIGSTSCLVSGDFNSNNCYPQASAYTDFSCTQDGGSCSGSGDSTATFTCTFTLWYNADPTDSGTPWTSENWLATAKATDDNAAASVFTEASTGNDVASLLAFTVPESSIGYGGLQPGQHSPDPLSTTTSLKAIGNVGLDENVYGDTMCTTWTGADTCDVGGLDTTKQIVINNQHVATSSINYASSFAYALTGSTSPTSVGIHVQKTTATTSPQVKSNYWGIAIPGTITVAGNYTGQDTITAVTSAAGNW